MRTLSALVLLSLCCGCGRAADAPATLQLKLTTDGNEEAAFYAAWMAARRAPERGLAYSFPVLTEGLGGAQLELLVARYTGLFVDDEPVVRDAFRVLYLPLSSDGEMSFPPPVVETGSAQSDLGAIPASYLCGPTLVQVRAHTAAAGLAETLASDWHVVVTEPCDP